LYQPPTVHVQLPQALLLHHAALGRLDNRRAVAVQVACICEKQILKVYSSDIWAMALDYSRAVQGIVSTVHEWGLLNRRLGEWCTDEVDAVEAMWQRLVVGARPPPPGIVEQLV
jgi:hypothetical protein